MLIISALSELKRMHCTDESRNRIHDTIHCSYEFYLYFIISNNFINKLYLHILPSCFDFSKVTSYQVYDFTMIEAKF